MIALLVGVHVMALGSALGWWFDVSTVALVGIGLLFVLLGNLLPRARSTFIFGIRTPWTLSSETVWTSSHRVGGYLMVAAGILTVAAAFIAPLADSGGDREPGGREYRPRGLLVHRLVTGTRHEALSARPGGVTDLHS